MQGHCHFLTLSQGQLHMKTETYFSQKPLRHFNQILYVSFLVHEIENLTWYVASGSPAHHSLFKLELSEDLTIAQP